jgi:hypothetical protein
MDELACPCPLRLRSRQLPRVAFGWRTVVSPPPAVARAHTRLRSSADRAADFYSAGRRFESCRGRQPLSTIVVRALPSSRHQEVRAPVCAVRVAHALASSRVRWTGAALLIPGPHFPDQPLASGALASERCLWGGGCHGPGRRVHPTYLVAIDVEGKTPRTIDSYAESLEDFRRVGRALALPNSVAAYEMPHVYAFLAALKHRGASAGYQNRRHREVRALFSWCRRMGVVDDNVFGRVPLARQPKKIPPPLLARGRHQASQSTRPQPPPGLSRPRPGALSA